MLMSLDVHIRSARYSNNNVLKDIDFRLDTGGVLTIVGESGAGKTTLGRIVAGLDKFYKIDFEGYVRSSEKIGYVPQSLSESMDPVFSIEYQMKEIKNNLALLKNTLLDVGLKDVDRILKSYPHNLSGGMKQRVLIALALLDSKTVVADEPTSALDKTTQRQIVKLFEDLNKNSGISIIFITHDLDLLKFDSSVIVLYNGLIIEYANSRDLLKNPMHPYTRILINAAPKADMHYDTDRFAVLDNIEQSNDMCPFVNICEKRCDCCYTQFPKLKDVGGRLLRCHV